MGRAEHAAHSEQRNGDRDDDHADEQLSRLALGTGDSPGDEAGQEAAERTLRCLQCINPFLRRLVGLHMVHGSMQAILVSCLALRRR